MLHIKNIYIFLTSLCLILSISTNAQNAPKAENIITNGLKDQWCNFLQDQTLTYRDFRKFFDSANSFHLGRMSLKAKRFSSANCKLISEEVNNFPMQILKYKSGRSTYAIILNIDNNHLIKSFSLIDIDENIKIEEHFVPMSDGIKLHTISLYHNDRTQRGTVFLKTPYFEINQPGYFNSAKSSFLSNGYNFVIQSNRGSFLSQGNFRWLNPMNVKDSYETIEWISNQSYSNKKVMSYGISYDGHNALASSVNAHDSLKAVIACSAPSNINTDSLSANQRISKSLLEFIAHREQLNSSGEIDLASISTKTAPLSEWDNILYKKNIEDWDDLVEASNDYSHPLWKERSLLDGIANSHIETLHVAGLRRDQDARDTILAYQHIQEHGLYPKKHKLFLHSGGHGCGHFLTKQNLAPYLSLISDEPVEKIDRAQVTQYSRKKSGYFSGDTYPLENFDKRVYELTLDNENIQNNSSDILGSIINVQNGNIRANSLTLSVILKEEISINGTPELIFNSKTDIPDARIAVTITFKSSSFNLNQSREHENIFSRSSILVNNQKQSHITYPPKYIKLNAGTKIFVTFTQKEFDEINPNTQAQDRFYNINKQSLTHILKGATLTIPVDK